MRSRHYLDVSVYATIATHHKNSPPTRKEFFVYRGTQDPYVHKGSKNKAAIQIQQMYTHNGFVSTSLNPAVLNLEFFSSSKERSGLRIRVLPKTICLILFPVSKYVEEMEIVFPHNSMFYVENGQKTMYVRDIRIPAKIHLNQ